MRRGGICCNGFDGSEFSFLICPVLLIVNL